MSEKRGIDAITPEEWDSLVYRTERLWPEQGNQVSPKKRQVGGGHYVSMEIQPIDYCVANEMDPYQTNIIKYASRMYLKNQCLSDLDKIIHYAELAKENAIKKGIA